MADKPRKFFDPNVSEEEKAELIREQERLESAEIEGRWAAVREKLGNEEIYLAFREYFKKMFNAGVLDWVGSLYDPETGLFYSSRSGKLAEKLSGGRGYYPHPEATSVALSCLGRTGAAREYGGNRTRILPELAVYKIVYYLKTIQDPSGRFFVPQIDKSVIAPERVGRDHYAARNLFTMLDATPTYDFEDFKGDGIDGEAYWNGLVCEGKVREEDKPTIYWTAENLAARNGGCCDSCSATENKSEEKAAPKQASSTSSITESHDAFLAHLMTKDPYNNPYGAISNINSIAGIVNAASAKLGAYSKSGDPDGVAKIVPVKVGEGYRDLVINNKDTLNDINVKWMNLYINEAGLFGKISDKRDDEGNVIYDGFHGGWGFNNSNGFMKGISRYFSAGLAYPEPRRAAESLLKGINNPESAAANGNVLVVYNVWNSLGQLKSNIATYYTGDDKEELLDYIESSLENKVDMVTGEKISVPYAALAIERAFEQVQPFRKVDGGYGHSPISGTPCWQGGIPVGVSEENLSDTDATFCTMTSLSTSICSVFGINMSAEVPMYSEADLYRFLNSMSKQPRVIKKMPFEMEQ